MNRTEILTGEDALPGLKFMKKRPARLMPYNSGMTFKHVPIYLITPNQADVTVFARWLATLPGPIRKGEPALIHKPSVRLSAIEGLAYGPGTNIALETSDGEILGQFVQWMMSIIGPPKEKHRIVRTGLN